LLPEALLNLLSVVSNTRCVLGSDISLVAVMSALASRARRRAAHDCQLNNEWSNSNTFCLLYKLCT
tara:strand:+ start:798 stop:995 length:198 start_codon:yes stop_codon:yes gene_type:complete